MVRTIVYRQEARLAPGTRLGLSILSRRCEGDILEETSDGDLSAAICRRMF